MKMKINIRLRVHKKVLLMFFFCFVIVSSSSSVCACVIFCVIIEQRFRVQVVKYVVYSKLEKFLLGRYIIRGRKKILNTKTGFSIVITLGERN